MPTNPTLTLTVGLILSLTLALMLTEGSDECPEIRPTDLRLQGGDLVADVVTEYSPLVSTQPSRPRVPNRNAVWQVVPTSAPTTSPGTGVKRTANEPWWELAVPFSTEYIAICVDLQAESPQPGPKPPLDAVRTLS